METTKGFQIHGRGLRKMHGLAKHAHQQPHSIANNPGHATCDFREQVSLNKWMASFVRWTLGHGAAMSVPEIVTKSTYGFLAGRLHGKPSDGSVPYYTPSDAR